MTWDQLHDKMHLSNIQVTIINPVRKDEYYKAGRFGGFKAGIVGGSHHNYKNGVPHSYNNTRRHWIKKPKVLVMYNCFDYMSKKVHCDWVDADNCTFEIIETNNL